ncbi:UDP binding domain-containing protein [Mesorhizobium sp. M1396]|uniref:UDP binding domain-containing protein n=1 Tax=Mesorhizobium sp. M1396 TaxID=2957095 RepID=UPI00333C055D
MDLASRKIAIIGLGYVGLPLAVAFGATRDVVGFDINQSRVDALERGEDHTLEAGSDEISAASRLRFTTHKAQELGYHPEVILAGRRINDGRGRHAADQTARLMMRKGIPVVGSRILVMGAAFKENCPELRNSRVADVVARLKEYNAGIDIWDPWVDAQECARAFGITSMKDIPDERYDGVIVAVGHRQFRALGVDGLKALCKTPGVIYDIKGLFLRHVTDGRF